MIRRLELLDDDLAVDRLAGEYRHPISTPFIFADYSVGDSETVPGHMLPGNTLACVTGKRRVAEDRSDPTVPHIAPRCLGPIRSIIIVVGGWADRTAER